ncbi:hypothetical protein [Mycolicibacterium sp. XJ1819]
MGLAALIVITLCCIAWSLWIRRVTWTSRWEVAATLNIALQGLAVMLMSPWASETVGVALHALTGKWNLEDFIGHDAYIVAASAVVYNSLGRLQEDHDLQRSFRQWVEFPATICIPLLLVTFWLGNGSSIYHRDFFQVPTDFWLNMYWLLLCGLLIYLLAYGARALLILRKDPRSRTVANVYLVASASGVAACVARLATAFIPPLQSWDNGSALVWVFACGCGAGFALMSAESWRRKTRWFSGANR